MQVSSKPHVNNGKSEQEKLLAEFAYQPAAEGRKHAGQVGGSSDKVQILTRIQHEAGQTVSSDPSSSISTFSVAQQQCAAAHSVSAHSCNRQTLSTNTVAMHII